MRQDLGLALLEAEIPVGDKAVDIFQRISEAKSAREIFDCLALLEQTRIKIDATIEESAAKLLPGGVSQLAVRLASEIVEKLPPENGRELFKLASEVRDIRSLIRFLANLNGHEIKLEEEDFVTPAKKKTDHRKGNGNGRHEIGMKKGREHSEYHNTPQKDLVRTRWRDRLQKRWRETQPNTKLDVFALFGEECLELPIYKDLGIPHDHMYGAEFDPAIFEKMHGRVPFHLFAGNCAEFALQHNEHHGPKFNIMNLDLFGPAEEFFGTEECNILDHAAEGAEIAINTRARQDPFSLTMAFALVSVISQFFPEILSYIQKLYENKKRIIEDEQVARHMVLREIFFIKEIFHHSHPAAPWCCKKAMAWYEKTIHTMRVLDEEILEKGKIPEHWPKDTTGQLEEILLIAMTDSNIRDITTRIPHETFADMKKFVRKNLWTLHKIPAGMKMFEPAAQSPDDLLILGSDETLSPEEKERAEVINLVLTGFSREQFTRMNTRRRIRKIDRITYSHGGQHTMQTWFMRFDNNDRPVSLLQALKYALDALLHASDTFIDNKMQVRSWMPDPASPQRVDIAKGRVIDFHKSRGVRKSLSPKEKEYRLKRKKIAVKTRRKNRKLERGK